MRGKHPNNKNIGSKRLFSCKSLREFNNFHARYRVVQNLDFIWLAFTLLPFDYCWPMPPSTRAPTRALIVGVFLKSASQVFTSQTPVGLTFKDFLTTFRLACHILSTNRSCQTKGPKSTEDRTLESRITQAPLECKLAHGWMSIMEFFFCPPES